MSNSSNPMDCSLPGSSIHGIFQARVQEWGAIAFSVIMCYFLVYSKVMQFYTHTHTHTCICIWASLIAHLVKNPPAMKGTPFNSWVGKICWKRDRLPTPVFLGFSCGSAGKESACNVGDLSSIPWLGRSPGEGKGYPLQYSGLENSMDWGSMGSQRVRHD